MILLLKPYIQITVKIIKDIIIILIKKKKQKNLNLIFQVY